MISLKRALAWYPINGGMSDATVLENLLSRLQQAVLENVPGDVVEMGCHTGTTSIFLQRMLNELLVTDKRLHLYDSFQGLPAFSEKDNRAWGHEGDVRTSLDAVVQTFREHHMRAPAIHPGWFSELHECEFPDKVCFAFFDGDLYQSILDSFTRIYHHVAPGGWICVHDYNVDAWPGTKRACDLFLVDKPEKMQQPCGLLGVMQKL